MLGRLRHGRRLGATDRLDDLPAAPTLLDLQVAWSAANSGRAADIEHLALLLLAVDVASPITELEREAESLLISAGPSMWRNLDLAARRSWWRAPQWSASAAGRVSSGQAGQLGLVVASFHPSGYVRQAAVARLGELGGPLAARALAVRTSDWVQQVRAQARDAVGQHLTTARGLLSFGAIAESFAARVHGRWLAEKFEESIGHLDEEDLRLLCAANDWRLRRAAYRVALQSQRLTVEELLNAAERDGDLVIRTRCADEAIRLAAADDDLESVRPLAGSGTAAVRAAAISALARLGDFDTAINALPDPNPLVREVARSAARRSGLDVAERYRQLVSRAVVPPPGAVAGLGEAGTPDDRTLIEPALGHPAPRGRVEAIRALRRLVVVEPQVLLPLLRDPSGAVTRQAAQSLKLSASSVPITTLEPLLDAANAPHIRAAAYRVLREHDVWTRLRVDLELYDDPDESLRNRARSDIAAWLTREAATTYSMPDKEVAERLDRLLIDLADTLSAQQLRLLRFHLGLANR